MNPLIQDTHSHLICLIAPRRPRSAGGVSPEASSRKQCRDGEESLDEGLCLCVYALCASVTVCACVSGYSMLAWPATRCLQGFREASRTTLRLPIGLPGVLPTGLHDFEERLSYPPTLGHISARLNDDRTGEYSAAQKFQAAEWFAWRATHCLHVFMGARCLPIAVTDLLTPCRVDRQRTSLPPTAGCRLVCLEGYSLPTSLFLVCRGMTGRKQCLPV